MIGRALDRLLLSSGEQRALRLLALLAAVGFLAVLDAAGGTVRTVLALVAVVLALGAALAPESGVVLALLVYLGVLWWLSVPTSLNGWTLLAAALLTTVHVACTLASYGPPGLWLDPGLRRRWAVRWLLCLAAAAVVAVVARLAVVVGPGRPELAVGAALVLVLAWVGFWSVRLTSAP